ncbi:MAG: DNA mismatch repair protein MutS [Promethearchaeota archaeon]|nr:MAG: DNA mismatch repair protein MutS [Candidatus Lokiarchaeota archaeon]
MTLEEIDPKELTPMMKHWYSVKKKYPNHLVAYRMGDFYEFFYDDAVRISNLLGITLTKRKIGNDEYPLAGIPHHSGNYFNNLVNLGETVVIVEQLEDPSNVKGRIVKRGVVRIVSPGTVTEADMLDSDKNNYIASIIKERNGYGCAFAELSTGEFIAAEFTQKQEDDAFEKLLSVFSRYDPVELIIPSQLKDDEKLFIFLTDLTNALIKDYKDYIFSHDDAYETIIRHFNVSNLKSFGLEGHDLAIKASGGLLSFLKETQRDILPNIFKIQLIKEKGILHLDYTTQRNLELTKSLWDKGKDTTLYSIFNHTQTPMGSRLLKKIMLEPLTDVEEIESRLNIVKKFKDNIFLRSDLREQLEIIGDLERYINRINYRNRTNARDLNNIRSSLEKIPIIRNLLEEAQIPEIESFLEKIHPFKKVQQLISKSIKEEPPTTIKEGNIIKDGYNEEIDDLRDILRNGKNYILEYEETQKKRFNLKSGLKVGHNNILGYYIQITKNTLKSIPEIPKDYIERQTLKNSKRYTTKEVKELEEKIISAEEKINDLEYSLFCEIRDKVIKETVNILETAKNIAMIDVLACFAEIAEKYDYCPPKVNKSNKIEIINGRHPVIEQMNLTEQFIPNNCYLDTETEQILMITGPNMAGKSTYLRQVALICLIAQMGCFVPAESAEIGIIDQIFTRIGASDDLARKLSTFMIEMTETAKILNYASPKSLVIIDELGRGTSTSDGQSIAFATLEKLHELKVKTLFSTHYHQLTEIKLPRLKNYHLDIIENEDGSINFVRKLKTGSTDKSYGIHVARLAGIPDDVIIRAFEILEQIEQKDPFKATVKENGDNGETGKYYEKFISEKKAELNHLNSKLERGKEKLADCNEKIFKKEKEIQSQENKIENLKAEIGVLKEQLSNMKKGDKSKEKTKKTVQTTFFKPVVKKEQEVNENIKELVDYLKGIDLNSITPLDAMKCLMTLKEKVD